MKALANWDLKKRYVFSFIVVSTVPVIIIMALLYIPIKNLFKEEAIKSDMLKSRQLREIMDIRALEVFNTAVQASIDKTIHEFLYVTAPLDASENYYVNNILQAIRSYRTVNGFISFFAVYFKKSSTVVTFEGKYDSDYFFENVLVYEGTEPVETKKLMSGTYYNKFLPMKNIRSTTEVNGKYVTYIQSIPIGSKNAAANIIVLIKEKNMAAMVGGANPDPKKQVMILKKDGQVIFANKTYMELLPEIMNQSEGREGSYILKVPNLPNVIVSCTESDVNDWIYVIISNMDDIISKVDDIRNLTILIILLALSFSLILSVKMANFNYSPWNNLIKHIKMSVYNRVDQGKKQGNECQFTIGTIDKLLMERKQLRLDIDKSKDYILSNTLMNICTGKSVPAHMDRIRDILPYKLHCVIVADFEKRKDLKVSLSAFLTRLTGMFYNDCIVNTFHDEKEHLCIILNTSLHDHSLIIQEIKRVKSMISNHFDLPVYIGIGNVYEEIDRLYSSYQEAKKSLEYCLLKGNDTVIFFQEIDKYIFSALNLPVHSGNPLLNSVKIGDFQTCSKLLDEYFKNIIDHAGNASVQYMYCLFYNFVSVILKACDEIQVDFVTVFGQTPDQILDIDRYRNSRKMIDEVYKNYKILCDYVQKHKSSQNVSLKIMIEEIVNASSSDKNFFLVELADRLGYSSSYLSRFINQEFGMGFSDLLNLLRIEKAKTLLSDGRRQITEISDAVGYSSINSFTRSFKRIVGITPGQYRESIYGKRKM